MYIVDVINNFYDYEKIAVREGNKMVSKWLVFLQQNII